MSIRRSQEWIDIPKGLSIAELMQQNPSKTPPSKIIYEEALTGRTVTYGEFTTLLKHGASHIQQCLGLQPGQVVSIISPSCIDYILAAHAIWWAGGVTSLINDALHADEISYALQMIQPAFVVIHSSLIPSLAQTVCGPYQPFRVFTIGPTVNEFDSFFPPPSSSSVPGQEEALALRPYSLAESDSHAACAAILLSSGTTGRPKAVMLSHYNLVAVCHQLHFDNPDNWRSSQREIFFPPLSHVYGLYVCFTMCYWQGAYVCLMPRFDLEVYCRLMQDRQATLARLVPPVAKALAENPVVRKYRYPNLEYFSCSAAPLNMETAEKLARVFPGIALCQTYGCTELSGPCAQSGIRNQNLPLTAAGTLITNVEMRFLDSRGKDVGDKGPGEITVRGPNVMMGYKAKAHTTAEAMVDGSWYHTGDLGYINDDGYLIIYDRIKDIIKYKGFQVSPTELEEILVRHPQVDSAAVVGIWSDAAASELPRAYVVLNSPPRSDVAAKNLSGEIEDFVAKLVANYKRLRGGVVFLDALPKNSTGKVLRRALRNEKPLIAPRVAVKL